MSFIDSFLAERDARREVQEAEARRQMAEDFERRAYYVRPAVLKQLGLRLWVHRPNTLSEGEVHLVRETGKSILGMPEFVKICWSVRPSWNGEVVRRKDERGTPVTCLKCRAWLEKQ